MAEFSKFSMQYIDKTDKTQAEIGTLVNAGFPYALASRLNLSIPTTAYVLGKNGTPENWEELLSNHKNLIIGDLPKPPESDITCPSLRRWLEKGGKLLYFPGWKDSHFLKENEKLFGISADKRSCFADSSLQKIKWNKTFQESNKFDKAHVPDGIRYLYTVRTNGAEKLMETEDGTPVLVQNSIGKGKAILALGPISLPASWEWFQWTYLDDLIAYLFGLQLRSSFTDADDYSKIISLCLCGKDNEAIIYLLTIIPSIIKKKNLILAAELCQFLRTLGKIKGDFLAILMAWRMLKIIADDMTGRGYDYSEDNLYWFKMRAELESGLYGEGNLVERVSGAIEAFEEHNFLRTNNKSSQWTSGHGTRHVLYGLKILAEAIEGNLNPVQVKSRLIEAEIEFSQASDFDFPVARVKSLRSCLRLAIEIVQGPTNIGNEKLQNEIESAKKELNKLKNSLSDHEFAENMRRLVQALDFISNNNEQRAWLLLVQMNDRWLKGMMITILRLLQDWQFDPLSLIKGFESIAGEKRIAISEILKNLSSLKVEEQPLYVNLLMVDNHERFRNLFQNNLFKFDITDKRAARRIASVSKLCERLICNMNGMIIGGIRSLKGVNSGNQLEGRKERGLRNLLKGDDGVILTVSSRMGTVRVNNSEGEGIEYSKGMWKPLKPILVADIKEWWGFNRNECLKILGILGELRTVSERGSHGFHGTTLVVFQEKNHPDINDGIHVEPAIPLNNLNDDEFAGIFADDGAVFVSLPKCYVTWKNVKLHAEKTNEELVLENNKSMADRGTRHKSGAAYAAENEGVVVFILSQDGGCLVAKNQEIRPLW